MSYAERFEKHLMLSTNNIIECPVETSHWGVDYWSLFPVQSLRTAHAGQIGFKLVERYLIKTTMGHQTPDVSESFE